jgi:hypothetical protein
METPLESFLKFVVGFFTFISVSFGVTYLAQQGIIAQMQIEETTQAAQAVFGATQ